MSSARETLTRASAGGITSWLRFGVGACVFVAVAAGLDFVVARPRAALGAQTLSSLLFALELLLVAGVAGGLLWLATRVLKGQDYVRDFRDSILWSACLIGTAVMVLRMLR